MNTARPFPLILQILGGGFYFGGSDELGIYNGRFLTEHKDVIVVTSNHRVNAFGFFTGGNARGNAGIEDQRAAMLWVKRNIATFGGDPNNITLLGLSSGAASIGIHMTSPRTPPNLFQRVIMQSNPFGIAVRSQKDIQASSNDLAQALGCLDGGNKIDMVCIRGKPVSKILAVKKLPSSALPGLPSLMSQYSWVPFIDGYNIIEDPVALFERGEFDRNISVIMGTTRQVDCHCNQLIKSLTRNNLAMKVLYGCSA
jgi:carboxylesterase type B